MKLSIPRKLGGVLAIALALLPSQAQTPAILMFDGSIGSIGFAAGDVRTALEANGYSVTLVPVGNPSVATQSVRVIPGKPATAGLSSQGYAIQREVDGAATSWWVIGKDAPGAMHGGLELAEAVSLNQNLANVTNRQANPVRAAIRLHHYAGSHSCPAGVVLFYSDMTRNTIAKAIAMKPVTPDLESKPSIQPRKAVTGGFLNLLMIAAVAFASLTLPGTAQAAATVSVYSLPSAWRTANGDVPLTDSGAGTFTIPTPAGANGMLVVTIAGELGAEPATVTWGGVTMTKVTSKITGTGNGAGYSGIYYLALPASGTGPLALTGYSGNRFCAYAVYATGVNATPEASAIGGVNPGVSPCDTVTPASITPSAGALVVTAYGASPSGTATTVVSSKIVKSSDNSEPAQTTPPRAADASSMAASGHMITSDASPLKGRTTSNVTGGNQAITVASFGPAAPPVFDHLVVEALSPQTAGAAFDVTITGQDSSNITVNDSTAVITVSSSTAGSLMEFDWNGDGTYGDKSGTLVNGVKTIKARDKKAETSTITAYGGGATTTFPPDVTTDPAAFAQLQILAPGETAAPGTATGKTNTPIIRIVNGATRVTVNAVDAYWNLINTVTDSVDLTSSDGTATLPAPGSGVLAGGTGKFIAILNTTGNFTVTATNVSNSAIANDTTAVSVAPLLVTAGTWKSLPIIPAQTPSPLWTNVPVASFTNAQGTAAWDVKHIKVCNDATNLYLLVELWPGSTINLQNAQAMVQNQFWLDGDNNLTNGWVDADGTSAGAEDRLWISRVWDGGANQLLPTGASAGNCLNADVRGPGGNPFGGWQADNGLYYEFSISLAAINPDSSLVFPSNAVTIGFSSIQYGLVKEVIPAFKYTLAPPLVDHFTLTTSVSSTSVGAAFDVTITAQDINNNTINTGTNIITAYSSTVDSPMEFDWNGDGIYGDNSGTLVNGVAVIKARNKKAETASISATTALGGPTPTPPSVTTIAGLFSKLQILAPGETAAPGTTTGKTGTPSIQTRAVPLYPIVNAVDQYWNVVATATDTVRLTSTDGTATLPADAALGGGTWMFGITLNTAGSFTVTATDVTDGSKTANTSSTIVVQGFALSWNGDGIANLWNTSALNWNGNSVAFANGDLVTFDDSGSITPAVNIVGTVTPFSNVVNSANNYTFGSTSGGSIGGTGGLIKSGAGSLTLATANTFTGTTVLSGGNLILNNSLALQNSPLQLTSVNAPVSLGAGITNLGLGGLIKTSGETPITGYITNGYNNLTVLTLNVPAGIRCSYADIINNTTAGLKLIKDGPGWQGLVGANGFNAGLEIRNGTLAVNANFGGRINGANTLTLGSGANSGVFEVGNSASATAIGQTFAGLTTSGTGTDNRVVGGNAALCSLTVDSTNDWTYAGFFGGPGTNQNNLNVTKTGSGKLTLTSPSTHVGANTVNSGTLLVNNTTGSGTGTGAVTVNNATLGGNGTISGAVTVNANGTLSPGTSIGTLTLGVAPTLLGKIVMELDTTQSPSNDVLNVTSGTITAGGSLVVTNLPGSTLALGDSFKLFSGPVSGSFSSIVYPNPPNGTAWTNTLAQNGTIALVLAPAKMTFSVSGGELVLNWPAGQGWQLQAQTNTLAVGLTTDWVTVPGAVPPFTNAVAPANGSVFYRLVYP